MAASSFGSIGGAVASDTSKLYTITFLLSTELKRLK